jgi:uncharacterized protein
LKIGIISDTHDDIENVQEAINIFNKNEVNLVIHAGDYISPGVIQEFQKLRSKLIGVLGNNDSEKNEILKYFLEINGDLKGELGELEIEKLRIGIYHGTDETIKKHIIDSKKYNIIICGHTHEREPANRQTGIIGNEVIVLNPGSAHRKTPSISRSFDEVGRIIILDIQSKKYQFIDLSN